MTHLILPPKPLFMYKEIEDDNGTNVNIDCQLSILSGMQQLLLKNHEMMQAQLGVQAMLKATQT